MFIRDQPPTSFDLRSARGDDEDVFDLFNAAAAR